MHGYRKAIFPLRRKKQSKVHPSRIGGKNLPTDREIARKLTEIDLQPLGSLAKASISSFKSAIYFSGFFSNLGRQGLQQNLIVVPL